MFFGIGFDDNGDAEGMTWALDMLRARGLRATFFMTSAYGQPQEVAETWRRAYREGHEIGNHSATHLPAHDGSGYSVEQWREEIASCGDFLTRVAAVLPAGALVGFRTPFLEYNDATLAAVTASGLRYDCSIEEGFEPEQDGSNAYWPYTLDQRSPGHTAQALTASPPIAELDPHPGLWELPVQALVVPPDERCTRHGVPPGLRAACKACQPWFDAGSGAITGFDFNLWAHRSTGGFEMTAAQFLATLRHTFDQHQAGNRAPLLFGSHTGCYVEGWDVNAPGAPRARDRRAAIETLLDEIARQKDARIATHREVLDWMRNPTPLRTRPGA
jgi:peptidoglycan/xylan/chitin deacetylase (PgdA/CDA1 family)